MYLQCCMNGARDGGFSHQEAAELCSSQGIPTPTKQICLTYCMPNGQKVSLVAYDSFTSHVSLDSVMSL